MKNHTIPTTIKHKQVKAKGITYVEIQSSELAKLNIEQVGTKEDYTYLVQAKHSILKAYDDGPVYKDEINYEGVIGRQYHFGHSNRNIKAKLRILYND